MEARYHYHLRVTPSQAVALQAVFDTNRFVWNQALGRWQDLWRYEGLRYGYYDMCHELTDWRGRFEWLAEQPAQPQQLMLRDLTTAIATFFDKSNVRVRRPRFKKKGTVTSARWTQGFALVAGRLHLQVAGGRIPLRVVWSRPLPSTPKSLSLGRSPNGRWWVSFVVQIEPEELPPSGMTTGLDLGISVYATTEVPEADVVNPQFGRVAAKALARSQRNMDLRTPGSRKRKAARRRLARLHSTVTNQRRDFHQKEARKLVRRFDRIGVEQLKIGNMIRAPKPIVNKKGGWDHNGASTKVGLTRAIHDASWGNFLRALEWQAKKCGREVVRLPARNTTQNCSDCGTKAKVHVGLKQRTFECSECGMVLDRDRNAARNLNPGWAVPGDPVDGNKSLIPAGIGAARGAESLGGGPTSSQATGIEALPERAA